MGRTLRAALFIAVLLSAILLSATGSARASSLPTIGLPNPSPAITAGTTPAAFPSQVKRSRGDLGRFLRSCNEVRRFDSITYWFWHAYSGLRDLMDVESDRWGRLEIDQEICFQVPIAVLDNVAARGEGARRAAEELLNWLPEDDSTDVEGETAIAARDRLVQLTGQELYSTRAWVAWWEENSEFLWWSDDDGLLLVDEEARRAGQPLGDETLLLETEEYWFYKGRGWISGERQQAEFLLGSVLIPPHGHSFRIAANQIDDRDAKESGYKRALESLLLDGLMLEGPSLELTIELLQRLTGESLDDRDAWAEWWRRNGARLVLSEDGERLVIR